MGFIHNSPCQGVLFFHLRNECLHLWRAQLFWCSEKTGRDIPIQRDNYPSSLSWYNTHLNHTLSAPLYWSSINASNGVTDDYSCDSFGGYSGIAKHSAFSSPCWHSYYPVFQVPFNIAIIISLAFKKHFLSKSIFLDGEQNRNPWHFMMCFLKWCAMGNS